jgi:hypothetical protein
LPAPRVKNLDLRWIHVRSAGRACADRDSKGKPPSKKEKISRERRFEDLRQKLACFVAFRPAAITGSTRIENDGVLRSDFADYWRKGFDIDVLPGCARAFQD